VEPSATLAIGNAAAALEADGVDVVDLSVGEPDFPTPANVVEAGKDALDAGHTGYTERCPGAETGDRRETAR